MAANDPGRATNTPGDNVPELRFRTEVVKGFVQAILRGIEAILAIGEGAPVEVRLAGASFLVLVLFGIFVVALFCVNSFAWIAGRPFPPVAPFLDFLAGLGLAVVLIFVLALRSLKKPKWRSYRAPDRS